MKKLISVLSATVLLMTAAFSVSAAKLPAAVSSGVTVERIDFNDPGFLRGMDVSSVLSLERSGVSFCGSDGEEDAFTEAAEERYEAEYSPRRGRFLNT